MARAVGSVAKWHDLWMVPGPSTLSEVHYTHLGSQVGQVWSCLRIPHMVTESLSQGWWQGQAWHRPGRKGTEGQPLFRKPNDLSMAGPGMFLITSQ